MSEPQDIAAQIDSMLGGLLNAGWDESPAESTGSFTVYRPTQPEPEPVATTPAAPAEPQFPPLPLKPTEDVQDEPGDDEGARPLYDVGLLSDLATGRKTPSQAARETGRTEAELQSQLATALRGMPPGEIARAIGLQASEQQLKSGALFGAVLADLVSDLMAGRLKPADKLELAKLTARLGKIEPKEDKNAGGGSGFSLVIHMGDAQPKPVVIESD